MIFLLIVTGGLFLALLRTADGFSWAHTSPQTRTLQTRSGHRLHAQAEQEELFHRFHKGGWIGKQTLHDYTDDKLSDSQEIERSSKVIGVCLDVDDKEIDHYILRPREQDTKGDVTKVATYEIDTLLKGNKFCHTASIGGPLINTKSQMLSCQVSIVDDDGKSRVKVIVIYDTFDEMTVPGTSFSVPETMGISEVIILRESRVEDPTIFRNEGKGLDLGQLPNLPKDEELFGKSNAATIKDFEVDYKGGRRFEMDEKEEFSSEEFADEGTYAILGEDDVEEDFGLNLDQIDSPEGITFDVKMVHKGGLLVEAPRTLVANERTSITVSWKRDADKKMTTAGVTFVAMQNAINGLKRVKGGAEAQYVQPDVMGITVEELNL